MAVAVDAGQPMAAVAVVDRPMVAVVDAGQPMVVEADKLVLQ